jgi:DNA primase
MLLLRTSSVGQRSDTVITAILERFEVGHTPATGTALVSALRQQGFSDDELVDSGLASRRLEGALLTDYYRQRVLIPVRDQQDRICGLIGRNIGDARWPKYKNPPRTVAYDKSINLYQSLPAPDASGVGRVVVVEGTIDAMAIAVAAIQGGPRPDVLPRDPVRTGALVDATRLRAWHVRVSAGDRLRR